MVACAREMSVRMERGGGVTRSAQDVGWTHPVTSVMQGMREEGLNC